MKRKFSFERFWMPLAMLGIVALMNLTEIATLDANRQVTGKLAYTSDLLSCVLNIAIYGAAAVEVVIRNRPERRDYVKTVFKYSLTGFAVMLVMLVSERAHDRYMLLTTATAVMLGSVIATGLWRLAYRLADTPRKRKR